MRRSYDQTHPWLRFEINLGPAPAEFWMLLGEAQSKIEHIANVPLKPHVHNHFNQVYLAKGALATTAIEGNTLSEAEALARVQGTLKLPPSREYLGKELDNVVNAINLVWQDQAGKLEELCTPLIKQFNKLVLDGLSLDEGVIPGEIRSYSVGVARYRPAPHEDCEYLLERVCEWLRSPGLHGGGEERRVAMAIIRAVLAHLYIAWIHPFGDGNGRTARLVEFQILAQAGVPMSSAHLLSNHYNMTRTEYYRQLDQASRSGGDVIPFLLYAVRGFVDGLREQLRLVRDEQWDAAWNDFIHENLSMLPSRSNLRRRKLVLALSRQPPKTGVPRSKLVFLDGEIVEAYKGKTGKTLSRDLNELQKKRLIRKDKASGGYLANRRVMLAFAPMRKRSKNASSNPSSPKTTA